MGELELQEEQEARTLLNMLNHWHKIKMERQIDQETEEKKFNDRIMSFAERTLKTTVTKHHDKKNEGLERSSVIKAVSKRGLQSYKYQEIIRKQEALAEYKRQKKEKQIEKIKEAKFQKIQATLLERKKADEDRNL